MFFFEEEEEEEEEIYWKDKGMDWNNYGIKL